MAVRGWPKLGRDGRDRAAGGREPVAERHTGLWHLLREGWLPSGPRRLHRPDAGPAARIDARGDAIVVGGRRFPIGREYSLPFASEVGAEAGEAAASIGLPDRCSQRLLSMGSPG